MAKAPSLAAQFAAFQKEHGYVGETPEAVQVERTTSEAAGTQFLRTLLGESEVIEITATRVKGAKGSLRTKYQGEIRGTNGAQDLTDLLYSPADLGETVRIFVIPDNL